MRRPSPNFTRTQYLSDTLRRRFPGFAGEGTEREPTPVEPARALGQTSFEEAVRATFARSIPQHPAYNAQILYALKTFRTNNLATMTLANDTGRINAITSSIQNRRPRFRQYYEDGAFLHLHTLLKDYSAIKGGDLHAFPSIETLGHRRDEASLRKADPGPALERKPARINLQSAWNDLKDQNIDPRSVAGDHIDANADPRDENQVPPDVWVDAPDRWTKDLALRKQQLQKINRHLDALCPEGSYFNRTRQELIHQVWSNRTAIQAYKDALTRGHANNWHDRNDGSVWVPPDVRSRFDDVANETRRILRNARQNLEAVRVSRQIPPEDALKIDRLVRTHHRMSLKNAAERAASRLPPGDRRNGSEVFSADRFPRDHVPEAIKRAATYRETRTRTNPVAGRWAEKCEATIAELIPYEGRETLIKRIALQKSVFANRDYFMGGSDYDDRFTGRHREFEQRHWKLMKTKPDLLDRLARELDSYDQAWKGALRAPPEAQARPPAVPPGKLRKPASAFQSKDLMAAARAPGQQKLSLRPLGRAARQESVDSDITMSGMDPVEGISAEPSRKRKRDDVERSAETDKPASSVSPASPTGSDDMRPAKRLRTEDRPLDRQRSRGR